MEHIKKCPFCNGDAEVERELLCGHWVYHVRCMSCYAQGTTINNRGKAIENWNGRVYEQVSR